MNRPTGTLTGGIALAVAVLVGSACGVRPDSAPRDLPIDERQAVPVQTPSGGEAEGLDRIFLAAPGEDRVLRSVSRDAVSRRDLIEILFNGPNDEEAEQQYSTFIPPDLEVNSTQLQGTLLFIDVGPELTDLTGQSLSQALAQIVYTATELDGVDRVQVTVDGRRVSWPTPSGDATTDPLSIYDYPGFVQTAQPAFPALPAGS